MIPPPPVFDLSIVSSNVNQPACTQILTVKNNVVGDQRVDVTLARVEIVTTDGTGATSTNIWTIRDLPAGGSVTLGAGNFPSAHNRPSSGSWPVRRDARIIESVPAEPLAFRLNNAAEPLWHTQWPHRVRYNNGDAGIGVSVSDRFPQWGATTTFTVHAINFAVDQLSGCRYDHTQFDVQVAISLSPGLTFAETQPPAPSDTRFATSTGIWNVGNLVYTPNNPTILALPVAVTLSSDSLAELPLAERCLTAEVRSAPSWPADPRKRGNDTSTVCLGADPPVLLNSGEMNLFEFYPCVGVTSTPCTSADTLELVAEATKVKIALPGLDRVDQFFHIDRGLTWLQPESVYIHVRDPSGRGTKAGSVIWSTVGTMDLRDNQTRLTSSWSIKESVKVTAPGGGNAPGRWLLTNIYDDDINNLDLLDAVDSSTTTYEFFDLSEIGTDPTEYFIDVKIDFWELGTYKALFGITGRVSGTTYTDSGKYTFHVGPAADLEVRDGGASPAAATGQRAYTVMAVNNGPDAAPSVRVTGLPTGATALFDSEDGYDPDSGVWTIGELETGPVRHAGGMTPFPTLTLATTTTTAITATIENTQDYQVCIDSSGEDVVLDSPSMTACTSASSTNSWHTAKYFDLIEGNNTTTIEARAGTGEGTPGTPSTPTAEIHPPSLALLSWTPVQKLYGHPVTGYLVERSAGAGQTTMREVKGTIYADTQGGGGNLAYRVRALNEFGVKGPWSQVVRTQAQTGRAGAPTGLTVTASDTTTVSLSWTAPTDTGGMNVTIDGYRIDYSGEDNQVLTAVSDSATTTTTYTHSNLLSGHRYCYRVAAVNTNGPGDFSEWRCATTKDVPGAPAGLSAAASGNDAVSLSWAAPSGTGGSAITGYRIESSTDAGGSWQLRESSRSTTTYTHSSLSAGTSYCYRVAAVNANGHSAFSGQACATTEDVPGAPENLSATADGETAIDLSWSPPDDTGGLNVTIASYDVEYSVNDGVSWQALATVQSGTTHEDSGLQPGSRRCYRVKAVNTHGEGPLSGEACATTEGAPSEPRNLSARPDSETSIALTWDAPSDDGGEAVTGYVVQYYSTDAEDWETLAGSHATTTYVHTGLDTGVNYCYRVAATNANGTGDYSGQACATTEGLPDAPENLSASVDGKTSITLSWDAPADTGGASVTAIRYRIDYSTDSGTEWMALEHDHDGTSYGHTGLTPGTTYCYRVAVTHENGVGPYSDQACGTTEGNLEEDLPWEPENVRFIRVGKNFVTLKWDPPSQEGGKVEYYEYRHSNDVPVRVGGRTDVTVRGLSEGSSYDFQVRAGNSLGVGGWAPAPSALPVQATTGGVDVRPNPLVVEFKKNAQGEFGTRSFNVKLNGSPRWPMQVGMVWDGDADALCLTRDLVYQQFKILLPSNPQPSSAFWNDAWWGPPGDRYAARYSTGINIQVDASSCKGGETAVVHLDIGTVPWEYVASASMWDDENLNLNRADWEHWGQPFEGNTGPSVKLSAVE